MMNRIFRIAGIAGLTTLTAMASLGLGSVNVLADDAKLPAYVMNGTNLERAISDYVVNSMDRNENSVIIPHMDILKTKDNGSTVDVYGAYLAVEYTQDGNVLKEADQVVASQGHFVLNKNADNTFTVASYDKLNDGATKDDVTTMFGAGLADEAFAIHTQDNKELWNTIQAEDVAFYSYDNNLGLGMIVDKNSDTISLPSVSFSKEGAHTMYVQEDANVRSAGTTAATAFDGIAKGDEITVNGMVNGWGRVITDGRTGYISASLLGDKKPAKEVKEEKKAEKVETEGAHAATGYTVGRIEAYNGNSVTINGIKAVIGFDTAITGGEIRVGDLAKLEYWTAADGQINAKSLHTQGSPEEGLAIASDGRVAYTGEQAEEQTVAQASDGRVAYTGEQTTEQAEEQTTVQASDGRVVYTGEQTSEESQETAEEPAAEQAEEAPAAEETFDEIG